MCLNPLRTSPQAAALEFINSRAPEGVVATISWLENNGWNAISGMGGTEEHFGNALVAFRHAADEIRITRDRLEWSLQLRRSGWARWFDLSFIVETRNGRTRWDRLSEELTNCGQSSDGSEWIRVLPDILEWVAATNDVEAKIDEVLAERFRQLFPDGNTQK